MRLACAFAVSQAEQFLEYGNAPHLEHGFAARVQGYIFALDDSFSWEHAGRAGDALWVAVMVLTLRRLAGYDCGRESSSTEGR